MFKPRGFLLAVVLTVLAVPSLVSAQTSGSDRFFLSFIEDAAAVKNQWWEGQLEYADGESSVDIFLLRGVAAFQPWRDVEVGGRVGFGQSDTPAGVPDGSGATDLDLWGKYYFGQQAEGTEFAIGGVATIPTGDDTAGLGTDAFGLSGFGALRHQFSSLILSVNVGARYNEDGMVFGVTLDGQTSIFAGAGVIVPLSDQVTAIGEARFETERFDGADNDTRVLGGINWRPFNRGMLRAAFGIGLSDGSPNAQVLVAYATQF